MRYGFYLQRGQHLLLDLHEEKNDEHIKNVEVLNGTLLDIEKNTANIQTPYLMSPKEATYPHREGTNYTITSIIMGMNLRVTGQYSQRTSDTTIAIKLNGDMQIYNRRPSPRQDCFIGLKLLRIGKNLTDLKALWRTLTIRESSAGECPASKKGYLYSRVNISSSGICLPLSGTVEAGTLCVAEFLLEKDMPPIPVLIEIIWVKPIEGGKVVAGTRYSAIMKADQMRISHFITGGYVPSPYL